MGISETGLTPGQKAALTKRERYGAGGMSEIARRAGQTRTGRSTIELDEVERHLVRVAGKAAGRARGKGAPCDPDLVAWAIEANRRQDGCCLLTGIRFSLDRIGTGITPRPFAPSIDQIVAGRGYVRDNIRLICWATNVLLLEWGEDVALKIARGLVSQAGMRSPLVTG
jgi:hypothetical protein